MFGLKLQNGVAKIFGNIKRSCNKYRGATFNTHVNCVPMFSTTQRKKTKERGVAEYFSFKTTFACEAQLKKNKKPNQAIEVLVNIDHSFEITFAREAQLKGKKPKQAIEVLVNVHHQFKIRQLVCFIFYTIINDEFSIEVHHKFKAYHFYPSLFGYYPIVFFGVDFLTVGVSCVVIFLRTKRTKQL